MQSLYSVLEPRSLFVMHATRQSSCTGPQQYSSLVKEAVLNAFGVKLVQRPVLFGY
jgi:hypothetical protein